MKKTYIVEDIIWLTEWSASNKCKELVDDILFNRNIERAEKNQMEKNLMKLGKDELFSLYCDINMATC